VTLLAASLWRAAEAVDRRRSRSKQRALGVSAVGLCRRRAAYVALRVRPTDSPDRRKQILGTWIHKGALAALRSEHGAFTEVRVTGEGESIVGRLDAYHAPADLALPARRVRDPLLGLAGVVEDVKTLGVYAAPDLPHQGPYKEHLWQVHLYGHLARTYGAPGHRVLGGLGPLPVDLVRVRYIRRDDGAETVFERPYDPAVTETALSWLEQVRSYTDPEQAPRDHKGPTTSRICAGCPFVSRCYPPRADGRAPESSTVTTTAQVERILARYHRASQVEAAAKARKAQARALLDATEAGRYGPWALSWRGGKPVRVTDRERLVVALAKAGIAPPMTLDVAAAERLAAASGIRVPKSTMPNPRSASIWVEPATGLSAEPTGGRT
jgi:hypothetical protein